jgi:hypothetical protein
MYYNTLIVKIINGLTIMYDKHSVDEILYKLEQQIATVTWEAGIRRDIHGYSSRSYRVKRIQLDQLKNERVAIKRYLAESAGQMVF